MYILVKILKSSMTTVPIQTKVHKTNNKWQETICKPLALGFTGKAQTIRYFEF